MFLWFLGKVTVPVSQDLRPQIIVCGVMVAFVMLLLLLPICVVIIEALRANSRKVTRWPRLSGFHSFTFNEARQIE